MRYHLTPVRIANIQKSRNNISRQRCGKRGTLLYCWWECKLVQPLWKAIWRFLKKLKIEIPFDLGIPLLGITQEDNFSDSKDICTPMVITALFTIAKKWKQPKCSSIHKWIKMRYIHTMEYYSAIKRKILPYVRTWMEL